MSLETKVQLAGTALQVRTVPLKKLGRTTTSAAVCADLPAPVGNVAATALGLIVVVGDRPAPVAVVAAPLDRNGFSPDGGFWSDRAGLPAELAPLGQA